MNCRPTRASALIRSPVDERIAAMAVADLNGDGRPDIVFYGDAKDLEVHLQSGHERLERSETLAHRGRRAWTPTRWSSAI